MLGRLPWRVLLTTFVNCCVLTSDTHLSDEPSLQLSSENVPSSSLLFAAKLPLIFGVLSFSSFLLTALNFLFCFPLASLVSFKSFLDAESHLFGMTTLMISSLRLSGQDLFFPSDFLVSSTNFCSGFFNSVIFRFEFPDTSVITLTDAALFDLLSLVADSVLFSSGGKVNRLPFETACSSEHAAVLMDTSFFVLLLRTALVSCRVPLAVAVLILLFIDELCAKLATVLSQDEDGRSDVNGVASLMASFSLFGFFCPALGSPPKGILTIKDELGMRLALP